VISEIAPLYEEKNIPGLLALLAGSRSVRDGSGASSLKREQALAELVETTQVGSLSRGNAQSPQCLIIQVSIQPWAAEPKMIEILPLKRRCISSITLESAFSDTDALPQQGEAPWVLKEKIAEGQCGETYHATKLDKNGTEAICKVPSTTTNHHNLHTLCSQSNHFQVGLERSLDEEGEDIVGEQVLETLVHLLVHDMDPKSAPTIHHMIRLPSTERQLRRQRVDDVAILMQPLEDTIGARLTQATPALARRAAAKALGDVASSLCRLSEMGFTHGDLHPDNVMYDNKTKTWCMIDFGRSCVRLPPVFSSEALGVIAVDPELPESSTNRDLSSLIGNMELIWEHHCEQEKALFPQLKELLRQKYNLPDEDPDVHWMAPFEVCEDPCFSAAAICSHLNRQ